MERAVLWGGLRSMWRCQTYICTYTAVIALYTAWRLKQDGSYTLALIVVLRGDYNNPTIPVTCIQSDITTLMAASATGPVIIVLCSLLHCSTTALKIWSLPVLPLLTPIHDLILHSRCWMEQCWILNSKSTQAFFFVHTNTQVCKIYSSPHRIPSVFLFTVQPTITSSSHRKVCWWHRCSWIHLKGRQG